MPVIKVIQKNKSKMYTDYIKSESNQMQLESNSDDQRQIFQTLTKYSKHTLASCSSNLSHISCKWLMVRSYVGAVVGRAFQSLFKGIALIIKYNSRSLTNSPPHMPCPIFAVGVTSTITAIWNPMQRTPITIWATPSSIDVFLA